MLNPQTVEEQSWSLMGQGCPPGGPPPSALSAPPETDLWFYRTRTVALLRRYARVSVEIGRLPSLLGREVFRTRATSYSMKNFEDVVIFVTDMERSLEQLSDFDRRLLAMNILEGYSVPEVSRILCYPQRTIERQLQEALDELSRILLKCALLHSLPTSRN